MPTVTLGKRTFELRAPPSYSAQRDILGATRGSYPRAMAAALGLCCPELARDKRLKIAAYETDYNPLAFGGRVQDALIGAGIPREQIDEAGGVAYNLIAEAWAPTEGEVSAAEAPFEEKKED